MNFTAANDATAMSQMKPMPDTTAQANIALQQRANDASSRIRARLAAVADELRRAAQGCGDDGEKLLTLAQRLDEHATTGRHT